MSIIPFDAFGAAGIFSDRPYKVPRTVFAGRTSRSLDRSFAAAADRMMDGGRRKRSRGRRDLGGCYTAKYVNRGYRLSARRFRNKLVDTSRVTSTLRISGMSETSTLATTGKSITHSLARPGGYYTLPAYEHPTTKQVVLPVFAIDVTTVPNQSLNVAQSQYTPAVYRAKLTTIAKGSNISWYPLDAANPFDTTQTFNYERGFGNTDVGPKCNLNWIQAKFLFYPAKKMPGRINLDLVTFKEDSVMPCPEGVENVISDSAPKAFWESMLKKYYSSPLEQGNTVLENKFIRYLWRDSITIDCKTTVENEQNHVRHYNLFKRLNRVCRYDWGDTGTMNAVGDGLGGGEAGQDWITNPDVYNRTQVKPGERVFLLIRAFSGMMTGANATVDQDWHPSFDMVLRKSISQVRV